MRYLLPALIAACVSCGGCAAPRHEVCALNLPASPRGVIFAIDGAGGFEATSTAIRDAVAEAGLSYCVEMVDWSHGYGWFLADQIDAGYARDQGRLLAERICAYRRSTPGGLVFVVAHSAGSLVALSAAEALPAGSIDRMILLAPAVSCDYDLRPALCASQQGIDVFRSYRDRFYLGLGAYIVGTTDRRWDPPAGRVGFEPVLCGPCDSALYGKLRDHPWDPSVAWTGNDGGHDGSFQPGFLRAYVLPLLCTSE